MKKNIKNMFEEAFFKEERCKFITIIDELIDRLPFHEKWTINTLINYLNISYATGWFNRYEINYYIFDIGLSDYQCNDLFFIVKQLENKYECIDEGKYFFTREEFRNIANIELKTTKRGIRKEDYLQLISDIHSDNFSINIKHNTDTYKDYNKKTKYYAGWEHIIIDGCDNFPIHIINIILDKQYTYIKYDTITALQNELGNKPDMFNCIQGIIERAIDRSVTKAKRDITMIAPICHILEKDNQADLSFILPLYLLRNDKPDCVLVFNYDRKIQKYYGSTLLNLREALQDARILGSTEQYSWLKE